MRVQFSLLAPSSYEDFKKISRFAMYNFTQIKETTMSKTWSKDELSLLLKNLDTPIEDVCKLFPDRSFNSVHVKWKRERQKRKGSLDVEGDVERLVQKEEKKDIENKYKKSLQVIKELKKINAFADQIKNGTETFKINTSKSSGSKSEATAFLIASDWHMEEEVKKEKVNGLNEYNLEIASQRAKFFFKNGLRLVNIAAKDTELKNIVVALLGDFGSGNIHEELMETCLLQPMDAIMFAQKHIIAGLEYMLSNSDYHITVPCVVGNHMRITEKVHHSTEQENSLEYYMYKNIAQYFSNEKRINFIIPNSDDCYLNVYGYNIRFAHGHQFKYAGGVGGITIPLIKWLNIQNGNIHADYTIIGHFHQYLSGKNFMCNGSGIGFDCYGKKFGYEPPRQGFFLIDSRFGRTIEAPIILQEV